jgi:predicted  nucleic acid-binding Zn-ribbon protein
MSRPIFPRKWVFFSHFVYNRFMSASLGLFRLQQVDSQIDRARAQLDTIRKTLENDVELKKSLALVESSQAELHRAKSDLKTAEAEATAQKIKIEQTEASLYGGSVHNPKELQDLQRDVVSLKKHLATLEERELEAMLKVEKAESVFGEARGVLESMQSRLSGEHKNLLEAQSKLLKDMERLNQEREASAAPVEVGLMTIYNDLRRQKRGVAVTEFEDNSCSSCGATLTSSLQQNAKSPKQVMYCPSCGRILYAS